MGVDALRLARPQAVEIAKEPRGLEKGYLGHARRVEPDLFRDVLRVHAKAPWVRGVDEIFSRGLRAVGQLEEERDDHGASRGSEVPRGTWGPRQRGHLQTTDASQPRAASVASALAPHSG